MTIAAYEWADAQLGKRAVAVGSLVITPVGGCHRQVVGDITAHSLVSGRNLRRLFRCQHNHRLPLTLRLTCVRDKS